MSLQDEMQTLMGELGNKVPAEMMDKVGAFIGRMAEDGIEKNARKVGDTAPGFSLRNTSGDTVALDGLLAKGPVVVVFYRGEWCPFCDLELRAYQKALPEIEAEGAVLVAISPQSPEKSRSTVESRGLGFDVLSDPGGLVAGTFGLTFSMNDAEQELHKAFGADLPTINGSSDWDLPVPATFVIARNGRITWAYANSNYTNRAEPADVIQALSSLRSTH